MQFVEQSHPVAIEIQSIKFIPSPTDRRCSFTTEKDIFAYAE